MLRFKFPGAARGAILLSLLTAAGAALVMAADPSSGTIAEGSKELSFTSGPYPVANTSGLVADYVCDDTNPCDNFALTVELSQAYIDTHPQDRIRFVLTPDAPSDDVELQLRDADGALIDSSRNGPGVEEQIIIRPLAGVTTYTVETMGGTPATGASTTITLYTDPNATNEPPAATADALAPPSNGPTGLEFSASIITDLQRSENEPLIEIDNDGGVWVCGIASVSRQAEFAQLSTDGGDQFHLLGEPPRGQMDAGGGGDCGMAHAPVKNAAGFYNFAEAGLGPLTNFGTSVSADQGRSFAVQLYSQQIPVVDRQWLAFSDVDTVFMNYNNLGPDPEALLTSAVVVQRSDDAGASYAPRVFVSPNSGRVGPIRSMPAALNPAANGLPVVYYAWTSGNSVLLAVSLDEGATWNNCTATTADTTPDTYFPVADHDSAGNVYIGYITRGDFNAWAVAAPNAAFANCNGGTAADGDFSGNPGFGAPVRFSRDGIETTVYPWLTASGAPGRVAMSYYGSPTQKDVNDPEAKHTWHVYVSQSLDMLAAAPTVRQVRASTHPMHFGTVCLSGLSCDTLTPGDRSLGDFFAMDLNPVNGELVVTYMNSSKRPGDAAGLHDTAYVIRQIAGPSLAGGEVARNGRSVLRTATLDPADDALRDFSSLGAPAGTRVNVPAMDLTAMSIGPAIDFATGGVLADGGFTVTMKLADLTDGTLQAALSNVPAQSLLWIFRFTDGIRYAAASARWNPVQGFTFGHNGYVGSATECSNNMAADSGGGCLYYPGTTALEGDVDQDAGIIRITVPLALLQALDGQGGIDAWPTEIPARPGDRIYDAAVFTQANQVSAVQTAQNYLVPLDNSAPMDFLIPGGTLVEPPVIAPPAGTTGTDTARFGGAAGLALLLPLLALVLMRKRRAVC